MSITMEQIKELRDKTSAGISDCKKALEACAGDIEKAVEELRKKGLATALKKSGRATNQGAVEAYIHHDGKLGVLIELNCETDFVAKTTEFRDLARQIAMQIAVDSPLYVDRDAVPQEALEAEKVIYRDQLKKENKPDHIIEKILEGKVDAFYKSICLMELPTIRDPKITIHQMIQQTIGTIQENISVRRFSRFRIGDEE
jgi:elongation factor Ts